MPAKSWKGSMYFAHGCMFCDDGKWFRKRGYIGNPNAFGIVPNITADDPSIPRSKSLDENNIIMSLLDETLASIAQLADTNTIVYDYLGH
jgi:hypothetical protein